MQWNLKRSFFLKSQICSLSTSPKGSLFRTFNGYSFNISGELQARTQGSKKHFYLVNPPPPGSEDLFGGLGGLSEKLVMYDGHPYSVSGKLTQKIWERKKKVTESSHPNPPPPSSSSGLARHACNFNPPPPPRKKSCIRYCRVM